MSTRTSECPCSRETAEQLAASPEPDRVVTLVHGTFAQHAEWVRKGPLCKALKPDDPANPEALSPGTTPLPGTTLFSRFCWTELDAEVLTMAEVDAERTTSNHPTCN